MTLLSKIRNQADKAARWANTNLGASQAAHSMPLMSLFSMLYNADAGFSKQIKAFLESDNFRAIAPNAGLDAAKLFLTAMRNGAPVDVNSMSDHHIASAILSANSHLQPMLLGQVLSSMTDERKSSFKQTLAAHKDTSMETGLIAKLFEQTTGDLLKNKDLSLARTPRMGM